MTYERSFGTKEAGSSWFFMIYGFASRTRRAPVRQWPSAVMGKNIVSAGQVRGFDPRFSQKRLAGHGGLALSCPVSQWS